MSVDLERITENTIESYGALFAATARSDRAAIYPVLPTLLASALWTLWLVSSSTVLVAALIHLVVCATIVPVTARGLAARQDGWSTATDTRVKLLSSVIKSLQYVKLSALEPVVVKRAAEAREVEIDARTRQWQQGGAVCILANWTGQLVPLVCIVYVRAEQRSADASGPTSSSNAPPAPCLGQRPSSRSSRSVLLSPGRSRRPGSKSPR